MVDIPDPWLDGDANQQTYLGGPSCGLVVHAFFGYTTRCETSGATKLQKTMLSTRCFPQYIQRFSHR